MRGTNFARVMGLARAAAGTLKASSALARRPAAGPAASLVAIFRPFSDSAGRPPSASAHRCMLQRMTWMYVSTRVAPITVDHDGSRRITTGPDGSRRITTDYHGLPRITTDHGGSRRITFLGPDGSQRITTDHHGSRRITTMTS